MSKIVANFELLAIIGCFIFGQPDIFRFCECSESNCGALDYIEFIFISAPVCVSPQLEPINH